MRSTKTKRNPSPTPPIE
jgi:hypothetical protein